MLSKGKRQSLQLKAANAAAPGRRIAIAYRPIEQLKLSEKNPRIHSKKQVRQIARSIATFGFNVPVLVDARNQVVAGHGRVLACGQLGISEVPTICLEHLTEAQAQAFLIADNRLTENASWDEKLLGEQFKALSELELNFSLEVTGFEVPEIDILIDGVAPAHNGEDDPADMVPATGAPVSKPGDLWVLDGHRLFCGNALEASSYTALMNGKMAAAVFIDPPYNVRIDGHASGLGKLKHKDFAMASGEMSEAEFTAFLTRACALVAENSKNGSMHFICMDWRHAFALLKATRKVYTELKNLCIWVKDNAGMGSFYRSQHELIFVFKHGKESHRNNVQLGQFGRYRTNVWNYPSANSFSKSSEEGNLLALHPTVKPVALVADGIMDCTARGDIVLDAFLGSGTTIIAAERTGRVCCGMELDPAYVDTAIRRWQKFTGHRAMHAQTGKQFDELEQNAQKKGGRRHGSTKG